MEIKKIMKTTSLKRAELAEEYLIQELVKRYGDRCLNKVVNNNGESHQDKSHKIYIMM
jgi:hypothetical protein